jgi:glycosyltransferase involved in cell wall biosynthesis
VTNYALYNPAWHMMGGGEKYIASIGEFLARDPENRVTLLADRAGTSLDRIQKVFGLDCSRLHLEHLEGRPAGSELGKADVAVVVSNFRSFRSAAPKSVLILQIPYPEISGGTIARRLLNGQWREGFKDVSRLSLLDDARRANLVLVYSSFVRDVLHRHHHINAEVLYPPIDDFGPGGPKQNVILSVGRIFRGSYNDKRYDVLIDGFRALCDSARLRDWEYHIVGNAGIDAVSRSYLSELQERAKGYPVRFFVNEPYDRLRHHYAGATLFWHGAGFGVDEENEPERTEHFGMTTVEAMSAGCIPIVVNNGGQKEILRHGECGFVWNTTAELAATSAQVIHNSDLRRRLAGGARNRFLDFDHDHFALRVRELLKAI